MKFDKIINRWSFQTTVFWIIGFILILIFAGPILHIMPYQEGTAAGVQIFFEYCFLCIVYQTLGAIIVFILSISELLNPNFRVMFPKLLNMYKNSTLNIIFLVLAAVEIILFVLMSWISLKYLIGNSVL